MPFKSEKQRRYLWATRPDIAKEWAHKYPESNKGLPMYANKDESSDSKEKAAQFDLLALIKPYVYKCNTITSTPVHIYGVNNAKSAADKLTYVDIPHSDKPTYAGQEREEGEVKTENNETPNIEHKKPENAINSLLQKLSVVLSQPMAQVLEDRKAVEEGRDPAYQPRNPGIRRYAAPVAAVPPPMGSPQAQAQQPAQPQPAQPAQQQGTGMNSPAANPIQSFGPLSASGNINGNAAFGQKNSPDSLKTAFSGNPVLAELMGINSAIMMPDPDDLDYDEHMKTAREYEFDPHLLAIPAFGALSGGLKGLLEGPKNKKLLAGLRGAAVGGSVGAGALGAYEGSNYADFGKETQKPLLLAGGLGAYMLADSLLPEIEEDKKPKNRKDAHTPREFGEKLSVEIIQPFGKHKVQTSFPKQMRNSVVNRADATAIADAMAAAAPHGALDNTRVDLYGTRVSDLQNRMTENQRLSPLQRWLNRYESIEGLPDKTKMLPDAYHPHADTVWLPSGNPGVMMHELGHSIDFNGYPNNTARMLLAGLYARTAPTLWKEHAAWRKGKHYFLQGAAQNKLPPELVAKTLRDASRGKRMGLGSYWGAGLGSLAGLAGGAGLMVGSGVEDVRLPVFGGMLGGALGGLGGLTVGNLMAESDKFDSPETTQKYLNQYAKAYAKQHEMPFEQAQGEIQQLAQRLIDKKKKKAPKKQPARAKAAAANK
jgi:hypothetical protein